MCIACGNDDTHNDHPDALTFERLQTMAREAGVSPKTLVLNLTPNTLEAAARLSGCTIEEVGTRLEEARVRMDHEGVGEQNAEGPVTDTERFAAEADHTDVVERQVELHKETEEKQEQFRGRQQPR